MEFLDKTLQWATHADSFEVIGFLKTLFNCLGHEELGTIKKVAQRIKSKQEIKARSWKGPRSEKNPVDVHKSVLTPDSSVITPEPVCKPENKDEIAMAQEGSVLTPGFPVITPESSDPMFCEDLSEIYSDPTDIRTRWWKKYKPNDFVAFDVEGIDLKDVAGMAKERAGSVTCVDNNGKILLNTLIKREPHTFKTNTIGAKIAGFTNPWCLQNGRKETAVKTKLSGILSKKISVLCNAAKDFRLMDLHFNSFTVFDLQWFFRRPNPKDPSCPNNPMSLRDMYFFFFQEDIQPPNTPHSAHTDAKATMDVFIKGYCSRKLQQHFRFLSEKGELVLGEDVTPNLKKMEKKGLQYCSKTKKFVPIN